jgi:hypothetical protein
MRKGRGRESDSLILIDTRRPPEAFAAHWRPGLEWYEGLGPAEARSHMRPSHLRLLARLEEVLVAAPCPPDERRKRVFFALCILLCVPVITAYGTFDTLEGRRFEGGAIGFTSLLLLLNLYLIRRARSIVPFFRISVAPALFMIGYELATGAADGYALIWHYIFPGIVFFLFGAGEGLLWVLGSYGVAVVLLFGGLVPYEYPVSVRVFFLVTYAVVAILAYGLESSRRRFQRELLAEKGALEVALRQVKTLKGLLPMCASCRRIRNDSGYWMALEQYIQEQAGAVFSHGLCPQCLRELYPDMAADIEREKQAASRD